MRAAGLTVSSREADLAIVRWMARFGPTALRAGLGIVFPWLGALKHVRRPSPARERAGTSTPLFLFPGETFLGRGDR